MDVTHELISRYADGQAAPDEALLVEEAVARDPVLASELEDFRARASPPGPREVSGPSTLYALDSGRPRRVVQASPHLGSWARRAAALAAAILAIGVMKLTAVPMVLSTSLRLAIGPDGR
jgi:anti-sigma factor RsiW